MWRLVILLLWFTLHSCRCNSQYDMASNYQAMNCDDIVLSQEEQACLINFTRSMMSSYGSLMDSTSNSMDNSSLNDVATSINGIKGVFGSLCENNVCLEGIKKTYRACKSYYQSIMKFDMVSIIELFCYKNSNGQFCVNDLPNFQSFAPPSCSSVLSDQKCSEACAGDLLNVSSTCCYHSMLAILVSESSLNLFVGVGIVMDNCDWISDNDQCTDMRVYGATIQIYSCGREDYSPIWKMCKISAPKLCDLPSGSYPSKNEDQDKNSDAVIFGYIAVILIFSVIVLLLLIFVVKIKCKNRASFEEDYTKVPFDIEDSDAI